MKAFVKTAPGAGNMSLNEVAIPALKPGEALVRIEQTGFCGTDVSVYDGKYKGKGRPMPFPMVIGHEASGVVVELAPGTEGPAPGTRVAIESLQGCGQCYHCQRGAINLCPDWHHLGLTKDGLMAEYMAIPAVSLIPLPDGVSMEAAAILEPLAMAVHGWDRIRPMPGDPIGIIGPGPVGLLHMMVHKAAGVAPVVVFGGPGDEDRLELAQALGADVVMIADREEAKRQVDRLTGGVGMQVVIQAAGTAEATRTALDIVAGNGTIAQIGLVRETEIDALQIVRKNLNWLGVVAAVRRHWTMAIRLIETGKVQPERLITHRFSLSEAMAGMMAMKNREAVKVMVTPGH